MKRKLITLENVQDYICEKEINITKDMIIPPKVNDYLKNNGIRMLFLEEKLEEKIKKILKEEFKILDEDKVDEIIKKVKGGLSNGY
ncbi:hypothetical protein [uncultured Cetobacterium sp.]|uniref:hypothetical protein n=1 Tax=uncultured Cetobacterium sp. TaxID=527638 RepID=UPI00262F0503|nr:hypothetical protein [uncultured Cetobacterium sp.]